MLSQLRVDELLAAIGARTPAPASGAATALTAALAAALAELAARYAGRRGRRPERRARSQRDLVELGDADAAAYDGLHGRPEREDARARSSRVPEEIARRADEVVELAQRAEAR